MPITINWINAHSNKEKSSQHKDDALLRQAKVGAIMMFRIFPPRPGNFEVSATAEGDALDERKTLGELGLAEGATLYLRDSLSPITMKWISKVNGAECEQVCLATDTLRAVEMEALAGLGLSPGYEDLYAVSAAEDGAPLDELQTLHELGLARQGQVVYSIRAPQARISFSSCVTGLMKQDQCGHTLVLRKAKHRALADLDMHVSDETSYYLSLDPHGEALDESKTMGELGITADDTHVFVCERM
jgi:hypothetical protein